MDNQNGINLAEDFRNSGKTQAAYCSEHSISLAKLHYQIYKKNHLKPTPKKSPQPLPTFITFPGSKTDRSSKALNGHPFTIIQGRFSVEELVKLLQRVEYRD